MSAGRTNHTQFASAQLKQDKDDWQHLRKYGYAPGHYMSLCHTCKNTPIMDKRAITCRSCAEKLFAEETK